MAERPDDSEKTEEPSHKKLSDAHQKGDVAKSQEVSLWFGMVAIAMVIALFAGPMAAGIVPALAAFVAQPHAMAVDGGSLMALVQQLALTLGGAVAVPMLLLMVMAVAGNLVQHRPVFSGENMKPKLSKVSPLSGIKRIFGPQGLMNFLKGLAKLVVVSGVVFLVLWPQRDTLGTLVRLDLAAVPLLLQSLSLQVLIGVIAILTIIAGADFMFQRQQWTKKQRMTQQEVKDEHRQLEGDPTVKARLRQIRYERGRRRMMALVPEATVVVTNPTHYSVALKYEDHMAAPVCVAKGIDRVALKIREIAREHDIPVVENVPLARALYASVEVDAEIAPEHYRAVAQVIGYVMRLKGRMRTRSARA